MLGSILLDGKKGLHSPLPCFYIAMIPYDVMGRHGRGARGIVYPVVG